jgi:hypothetical protein
MFGRAKPRPRMAKRPMRRHIQRHLQDPDRCVGARRCHELSRERRGSKGPAGARPLCAMRSLESVRTPSTTFATHSDMVVSAQASKDVCTNAAKEYAESGREGQECLRVTPPFCTCSFDEPGWLFVLRWSEKFRRSAGDCGSPNLTLGGPATPGPPVTTSAFMARERTSPRVIFPKGARSRASAAA